LYVKNLSVKATEEVVMQTFCVYGDVERVKKIKDYAFVHFKERENALKVLLVWKPCFLNLVVHRTPSCCEGDRTSFTI